MDNAQAAIDALQDWTKLGAELACECCDAPLAPQLRRVYETAAELARAEFEAARAHLTALGHEVDAARAAEDAERELARAEKAAEQASDAAEDAELEVQALDTPASLQPRIDEARRAEAARAAALAANERVGGQGEVEAIEREIEATRAALDEHPETRGNKAIVDDLEAARRTLEAAARARTLREQHAKLRAEYADAAARVDEVQAVLEALLTVQAEVLSDLAATIERPLSALLAREVRVAFEDANGNPICRFTVDGVEHSALSTGQRILFVAGLLRVLGRSAPTGAWRVVKVDSIEAVSAEYRPALARMLVEAVRAGDLDDVFLAGCPDTWADVEGVEVIDLAQLVASATEEAA